jgi:prepilin-type N-terminal cleavage/methylation domain-containing protein
MGQRGLTLVELLIVIVIVLILLGLLLTAVSYAFKAARAVKQEADEKQQRTSEHADQVIEGM